MVSADTARAMFRRSHSSIQAESAAAGVLGMGGVVSVGVGLVLGLVPHPTISTQASRIKRLPLMLLHWLSTGWLPS